MKFHDFGSKKLKQESDGTPSLYVKLKSGDSVRGVLRGEIASYWSLWDEATGRGSVVEEGTKGAKRKFRANFIMEENGILVAKILDFGIMIYNEIKAIAEEYNITETKIKITREGEKLNTEYSVLPIAGKDALTPAQLKKIEAIPLQAVEREAAPAERPPLKNYAPGSDEAPF